jgi:hypothetical protein
VDTPSGREELGLGKELGEVVREKNPVALGFGDFAFVRLFLGVYQFFGEWTYLRFATFRV